MFRVWAFTGMLVQVPVACISERYIKGPAGNFLVWFSLILGQPLIALFYVHDYCITRVWNLTPTTTPIVSWTQRTTVKAQCVTLIVSDWISFSSVFTYSERRCFFEHKFNAEVFLVDCVIWWKILNGCNVSNRWRFTFCFKFCCEWNRLLHFDLSAIHLALVCVVRAIRMCTVKSVEYAVIKSSISPNESFGKRL